MTTPTASCESCGMPIETGHYCQFCTDADGNLQDFDTRFAAMVGWQRRRHPDQPQAVIEEQTRTYMASMPAWRGHPRLAGVIGSLTSSTSEGCIDRRLSVSVGRHAWSPPRGWSIARSTTGNGKWPPLSGNNPKASG